MKYFYLIRTSLLELLEYRANIPVRAVAYVLNIGLNLLLWLVIVKVTGNVFGYDTKQIILYYLFVFAVLPLVSSGTDFAEAIGKDIKEGDLVKVLVKPVSPAVYYTVVGISQRIKDFFVLSPLIILILVVTGGPSNLSIVVGLQVTLAAVLSFVIGQALMGSLGLVAFWTTQIIWLSNFVSSILNLFSGSRFPVNFFPLLVATILSLTPLYFLAYFPAALFLSKISGGAAFEFAIGIFWALTLSLLYLSLWTRGLKRYEGASQ